MSTLGPGRRRMSRARAVCWFPRSRNDGGDAMPFAMISIRVDAALQTQAALVLDRIGLTAETAVRLLFFHIAQQGTLPDSLKVPNAATQKAFADADAMIAKRRRATSPTGAGGAGMTNVHNHSGETDEAEDGGQD